MVVQPTHPAVGCLLPLPLPFQQQVEQGPGNPNAERMGPYASKAEAEAALTHAQERNEVWDAQDD